MGRFQVSWRRHVVILSHGITVLRSISAERARPIPGADFSAPELDIDVDRASYRYGLILL
jgi:hypothetical protein